MSVRSRNRRTRFLQLSRARARNDLDERRLLGDRLVDYRAQRTIDLLAAVVDVVQIDSVTMK
jgi:hypothetical protein